jgi:hypothetical protein
MLVHGLAHDTAYSLIRLTVGVLRNRAIVIANKLNGRSGKSGRLSTD